MEYVARMRERLERAYAIGDQRTARALARGILRGAGDERGDLALEARAREVLMLTAPDPFLGLVGLLGLGLMAWLVYNYVW